MPIPPSTLPPEVVKAFVNLAKGQRDVPERKMLRAQHFMGGSVMSFCIEQVGDLLHRMNIHADRGDFQRGLVEDKCKKSLNILQEQYGFEKEFLENLQINADIRGLDFKAFKQKAFELLQDYSIAYSELMVYNKLQYYARESAIYLGLRSFAQVIQCLQIMLHYTRSKEAYIKAASEYTLLPDGKPKALPLVNKNSPT